MEQSQKYDQDDGGHAQEMESICMSFIETAGGIKTD
jgi:hypothetical protein